MAIILQAIANTPVDSQYRLDLLIDEVPTTYHATVKMDRELDEVNADQELFWLLSERSFAEQHNSTQYHADLVLLLIDVAMSREIELPFIFGVNKRFHASPAPRKFRWWQAFRDWQLNRKIAKAVKLRFARRPI